MNRKQVKQQMQQKQEEDAEMKQWKEENTRIMKLVNALREARASGGEWTVVIPDKYRETVENIAYWEEQREREEQKQQEQEYEYDDNEDYEECCRNCGSNSVVFEGCCSVRCAKDADEYY